MIILRLATWSSPYGRHLCLLLLRLSWANILPIFAPRNPTRFLSYVFTKQGPSVGDNFPKTPKKRTREDRVNCLVDFNWQFVCPSSQNKANASTKTSIRSAHYSDNVSIGTGIDKNIGYFDFHPHLITVLRFLSTDSSPSSWHHRVARVQFISTITAARDQRQWRPHVTGGSFIDESESDKENYFRDVPWFLAKGGSLQ